MSRTTELFNYYIDHPYDYVVDIIKAKPTYQQKLILDIIPQAIKEKKGIAVRSGHGVGKTSTEAWCIKWFMDTRFCPKIIVTAPTQHQLYDVTWAELALWHKQSLTRNVCEWKKTSFVNNKNPENWFAVARTSNKPDNMQGFHAKHLLFIVEEASGVATEVLEVIEGTQTQEGSLVMYFGNPTQTSGGFYDAFHDKQKFYFTFVLNAEESPLVDPRNNEKIALKYGKDSDIYRVRVLGKFPKSEPDSLIPLSRIENAVARPIEYPEAYEIIEIGADIARFGDDETTIYSRIGTIIREEAFLRKRDLMTVTGTIVNIIQKYHDTKTVLVNIDDTGLGGGVTDRLKELVEQGIIKAEITGVNNGSRALENDKYMNVGTEMWFFMREWLLTGTIPNDSDLAAQLSSRKYKFSSTGKNIVEPKEQMKTRSLPSPDRADGSILSLHSLIYGVVDKSRSYVC